MFLSWEVRGKRTEFHLHNLLFFDPSSPSLPLTLFEAQELLKKVGGGKVRLATLSPLPAAVHSRYSGPKNNEGKAGEELRMGLMETAQFTPFEERNGSSITESKYLNTQGFRNH